MHFTELYKVIILKNILNCVIGIQQPKALAPPYNKANIFGRRKSTIIWFILQVAFQSLQSQPLNGICGVFAWHSQPFISYVHGYTRHFGPDSELLLMVRNTIQCNTYKRTGPGDQSEITSQAHTSSLFALQMLKSATRARARIIFARVYAVPNKVI